ncbi:MAG: hypothetical protein ACJ71Z_03595 [Aeromicrobium sp.]
MTTFDRATRVLLALLAVAFVVSVVHYVDNVVNYTDYPAPAADGPPAPTAVVIAVSWFIFTAAAVAGLWMWFHRRIVGAALAFASYSISGLIGIGHYTVPGAIAMPWWRQAHVITDILCGIGVFAFAIWALRRRRDLAAG